MLNPHSKENFQIEQYVVSTDFEKYFIDTFKKVLHEHDQKGSKEWMSLKEGASYASVSYNTFIKFREMGLKVSEIDGVKRVSKKEINFFLTKYSY